MISHLKKSHCFIFLILLLSPVSYANPPFNMAYVEVNDNALTNAACYIRQDNKKPLINLVSIFAANINGNDPNHPHVSFNPNVDAILNHSHQVTDLQSHGIKVLLTLLGNHQQAGWACMTNDQAIQAFAEEVVYVTNKYHLDGIDIDDEYSRCTPNKTSLIKIAMAIKHHPGFKGKLLTKALFSDASYFLATYEGHKLADFLDLGWEMTYGGSYFEYRLKPYVDYGMSKNQLALGVSTNLSYPSADAASQFVMKNVYGGVMIYNLTKASKDYLNPIAQQEFQTDVEVVRNCLK